MIYQYPHTTKLYPANNKNVEKYKSIERIVHTMNELREAAAWRCSVKFL